MAKDPAFLFYSSDFLSGIQDLTMEERGQYITLLCLQHQKGRLSDKIIKLSVGNAAADVMAKFRQDSASLWYNDRLEQETQKRKESAEKQRQRAVDGWEKRKKYAESNATAFATAMPLEDRNENKDINVIDNEKESKIKEASLKILHDFNFTETKNFNKLSQISTFVRLLFAQDRFEYFREQYPAYWKYKKQSGSEKQSLDTFLNDGWDREVWTEKLKQHGQSNQSTANAKQQSVADIREQARSIIAKHQPKNGS